MERKEEKRSLKFFGIGKLIPYLRNVRIQLMWMILCGLGGSLADIIMPLFQRYALDHFVGLGVFDTLWSFLVLYVLTLLENATVLFTIDNGSGVVLSALL